MRKSVIAGALVSLLAFPVVTEARTLPTPYLSITTAKQTVKDVLRTRLLEPFADHQPKIHVRCWKVSRATARCRATFTSDRLSGRVRARVREWQTADGRRWVTTRMGGLQID